MNWWLDLLPATPSIPNPVTAKAGEVKITGAATTTALKPMHAAVFGFSFAQSLAYIPVREISDEEEMARYLLGNVRNVLRVNLCNHRFQVGPLNGTLHAGGSINDCTQSFFRDRHGLSDVECFECMGFGW